MASIDFTGVCPNCKQKGCNKAYQRLDSPDIEYLCEKQPWGYMTVLEETGEVEIHRGWQAGFFGLYPNYKEVKKYIKKKIPIN